MSDRPLTEAGLLDLIDAYGADLTRWPPERARLAAPLLAQPSLPVREALDAARGLDLLFGEVTAVDAPEDLVSRILANAPARKVSTASRASGFGWLALTGMPARLGAALASLVMGITLGLGTATAAAPASDDFDSVMTRALGYDLSSADFLGADE